MQFYKLEKEVANSKELVLVIREKFKEFDYDRTYNRIIEDFRKGSLGKVTLDDVIFK